MKRRWLAAFLAATLLLPTCAEARKAIAHPPPTVPLRTAYVPVAAVANPQPSLLASITLGDVGYADGLRFSNLGGRREVFVPLPQGIELSHAQLVLALDDISAHDALRSLNVLVDDRSVAAIALDGKSTDRIVRIPLADVAANGFLKLGFEYSGAATQNRCIDVRYVGDSLTVRPDTAVEFDISANRSPSIAATAMLMPRDVAVLLSNPQPRPEDFATALTLARSLTTSGRHVRFYYGIADLPDLVRQNDPNRWSRGLIVVGPLEEMAGFATLPVSASASTISAAQIDGVPVLLVSNAAAAHAGDLAQNPLAALRDTPTAAVKEVAVSDTPADRVRFDALGVTPAPVDVAGRADLKLTIPTRMLPSRTKPSRLLLDLMIAPDSSGERAIVSAFVNEQQLASTVAVDGAPTRLDAALPDGLVGTAANVHVVIQRPSAEGDCRFEPQGFPAQILGSSTLILSSADAIPEDFYDLVPHWSNEIEVMLPTAAVRDPVSVLSLTAAVLEDLSKEGAAITVKFIAPGVVPVPTAPFLLVGDLPPAGALPRVRFDRGRVVVRDREGRTRLDLGGLASGAVVQIVAAGVQPGLWIKPLSADGSLPLAPGASLERGDVAFLDENGVALAMSTRRDALLDIRYPEQVSWIAYAERFRSPIFIGVWALATLVFVLALQGFYRRRRGGRTRG